MKTRYVFPAHPLVILLSFLLICGQRPSEAQDKLPSPPSPYEQIVQGAQSRKGLFTIYEQKGKWFFEIPKAMLGRDILWHVEAARVPADFPEGTGAELSSSMVKWVLQGDKIYVNGFNTAVQKRANLPTGKPQQDPDVVSKRDPVTLSIEQSGEPETLFAFPIVATSPAGDPVVDVSTAFLTELAELQINTILAMGKLPGGILDPGRSYVTYLKSFPRNVEASVHLTYNVLGKRTASFQIHHSLVLLPDAPMKPRLYDDRVGIFWVDYQDYSGENTVGVETKAFITRYRLEKKDPTAPLSEPVKPIVYYISREVPEKWRPYFKQAVEDWNEAFEAAGFKNAIIAKDAPTPEEDPDWSPADLRYSVIRWISSPRINAMGPKVSDPRSGEILSSHILIWANVVTLVQHWYYTLCAATDPRARTLPLPDEIVGRMMRYAVAHEVGHSLGLRHNHRASTAYTVKQLRDKEFTAKYGSTASIMAYGRMNYVAQPEDGLAPESLMPRIGPYDKHVIAWGYTPILEAKTPKDELPTLDAWASKAIGNPWLVWSGDQVVQLDPNIMFDPRVLIQNIGAERVEATRLGLKNLERAINYLPAAAIKKGRDFGYARMFYDAILGAWLDHMSSVVKEIGGVEENRTYSGPGKQFQRVSKARQKAALKFLLESGLRRPNTFMPASLYGMIQPYALVDRVLDKQSALLSELLTAERASLMHDAALFNEPDRYPYLEYISDLTNGVFEEVQSQNPRVDPLRRSLQLRFLTLTADNLSRPPLTAAVRTQYIEAGIPGYAATTSDGYSSDYRSALMMALQELSSRLKRAANITKDKETLAHFRECQRLVTRAVKAGETPVK